MFVPAEYNSPLGSVVARYPALMSPGAWLCVCDHSFPVLRVLLCMLSSFSVTYSGLNVVFVQIGFSFVWPYAL